MIVKFMKYKFLGGELLREKRNGNTHQFWKMVVYI